MLADSKDLKPLLGLYQALNCPLKASMEIIVNKILKAFDLDEIEIRKEPLSGLFVSIIAIHNNSFPRFAELFFAAM